MEIVIEGSSLKLLLDNPQILKGFETRLGAYSDYLVLVPTCVIPEIAEDPDDQRVIRRIRHLDELWQRLGNQFGIADAPFNVFVQELKGHVKGTKKVSTLERRKYERFFAGSRKAASLDPSKGGRAGFRNYKARMGEIDRTTQEKAVAVMKTFPDGNKQLAKLLMSYDGPITDRAPFQHVFREFAEHVSPTKMPSEDEIVKDRNRYRSIFTLASLFDLTSWGLAFSSDDGSEIAQMLRPAHGNHVDDYAASYAAYADVFLVEDIRLRKKCEFLRGRSLALFRSWSVAEWLAALPA